METKEKPDSDCKSSFLIIHLMASFMEGKVSKEEEKFVLFHLQNCEYCKAAYELANSIYSEVIQESFEEDFDLKLLS